jgi:hypothetical protein
MKDISREPLKPAENASAEIVQPGVQPQTAVPVDPVPVPSPEAAQFEAHCENPLSEWVYVKLDWKKKEKGGLPLYLTINFSKHTTELRGGTLEFGFKAGDLILQLSGALIPMESRRPKNEFAGSVVKNLKHTNTRSTTDPSVKTGLAVEKGAPGFKMESESKRLSHGSANEETFSRTEYQITVKGSDEKPIWGFEVRDGSSHLSGRWDEKIGMVVPSANKCVLTAEFSSAARHVSIMDVDGILAKWSLPMMKALSLGVYRMCRDSLSRCELSYTEESK